MRTRKLCFLKLRNQNNLPTSIRLGDIMFIEANRDRLFIKTKQKIYAIRNSITELSKRLTEYGFIRVNSNIIIHLDQIRSFSVDFYDVEIEMISKEKSEICKIPVSERLVEKIKQYITIWK